MLKIESNLKINGMHWGLAFVDGIAFTANASLAAKLLLKGYVVTDQPDQPVAGSTNKEHELSTSPSTTEQQTPATQPEFSLYEQPSVITPAETPTENPTEVPKPKPSKSRKKAVTADAADESGV